MADSTRYYFLLGTLISAFLAGLLGGGAMIQGADGERLWYVLGWTAVGFGLLSLAGIVWLRRTWSGRGTELPPPEIKIGAVDVPLGTQPIAEAPAYNGRVVRLKVANAEGREDAEGVHAMLTFERRDGTVIRTEEAQWENHPGETEITLPGTGREESLDLVLVLDVAGGGYYVWNRHSIAAKLGSEHQIGEADFWIRALIRGKGGLRAEERMWVFASREPRVGKESDAPPFWEQVERAQVQEELAAIVAEGEEIRGDAFTDPAWDQYSFWKRSAERFLEEVFGPDVRDRLARQSEAEDRSALMTKCLDALRAIMDAPPQVRTDAQVQGAIKDRRAAPKNGIQAAFAEADEDDDSRSGE